MAWKEFAKYETNFNRDVSMLLVLHHAGDNWLWEISGSTRWSRDHSAKTRDDIDNAGS